MYQTKICLLAFLIISSPKFLTAQDFSGGFENNAFKLRDIVGFAHWQAHSELLEDSYSSPRRRLKKEYEHCFTSGASVLLWSNGKAYWQEKGNITSKNISSTYLIPSPDSEYKSNATYVVDGATLTLTVRPYRQPQETFVFQAFAHGSFENDCGTFCLDNERRAILKGGEDSPPSRPKVNYEMKY